MGRFEMPKKVRQTFNFFGNFKCFPFLSILMKKLIINLIKDFHITFFAISFRIFKAWVSSILI